MKEMTRVLRITPAIVIALWFLVSFAQGEEPKVKLSPKVVDYYQNRELQAPPHIKLKIDQLRKMIPVKQWKFTVGYTGIANYDLKKITGLKIPSDMSQIAQRQSARFKDIKKIPSWLPLKGCSTSATSFDWRQRVNGLTPVKSQASCGSCWDFAMHAAFEGAWRIINNELIDTSEQATLDCNSLGYDCGGGANNFDLLFDKGGVAMEASYPYTGVKGTCSSVYRPYQAVAWGFVQDQYGVPSTEKIKSALCRWGPVAAIVRVTEAFSLYTGGIFNEFAPSGTGEGHVVTIIGWDDSKQTWLVKNSWGTDWGDTCGYGSERGYMWIAYGSNEIGLWAAWVQPVQLTNPPPPEPPTPEPPTPPEPPPPGPSPGEKKRECFSFNPSSLSITKFENGWAIVDNANPNRAIAFFTQQRRSDANQVLAIMQRYGMNEKCFVTGPFYYFLASGQPPQGSYAGETCQVFDPATLTVEEKPVPSKSKPGEVLRTFWAIWNGPNQLFGFADNESAARRALAAIQQYGFTHFCTVGGFHYWYK